MARPYPRGLVSAVAELGFDSPLPRLRRVRGTVRWKLRSIVLPELDLNPPATTEQPESRRAKMSRVLVRRVITTLLLALLLLVAGLVTFRYVYADRVYPAVVIGDVPVGGLTIAQAEAHLSERAADLEHGTVSFAFQGQTWTPTLSELGVTVKLDDSIAIAQQLGRGDNATDRLSFVSDILSADQVVPLRTDVDMAVLNQWFDRVDRDIDQAPIDARIAIEGTTVSIVPEAAGVVVDRDAATAHLLATLASLDPVAVVLPTRIAQPAISAEMLEPVQAEVTGIVSTPILARHDDREWEIAPETMIPFVHVDVVLDSGIPVAHLSIDPEELASELRIRYSHEVARKPADALLGWDNGLVAVEPSVTGAALRADAFAAAVTESFLSGHEPVDIPVVMIEPRIDSDNLDAYGVTELLGEGHSNFEGGTWERDENIRVGTELLNGTLVAPGENFSFNRAIGEITADKGYQEALVVVGDQVGRDVGGGVCQISTTVFRAALNGGMPIVEWHPHSFRLPNYERDGWGPGFDASILQLGPNPDEWPDFRFENYTDNWLMVESYIEESESRVYVNIYGTGDGRSISIDAWPIGGNSFGFTRVLYDREGNPIADRTFETHFL